MLTHITSEQAELAAPFGAPLSSAAILGSDADQGATERVVAGVIEDLEREEFGAAAAYLRREYGIRRNDHECAFVAGLCPCGTSL